MLGSGLLRPVRTVRRCAVRIVVVAVLVVLGVTLLGGRVGPIDLRGLTTGELLDRIRDAARDAVQDEAERGSGDGRGPSADRGSGDGRRTTDHGSGADPDRCRTVGRVVRIGLSSTRYPEVRAHWEAAIDRGRPRVLTVHRSGATMRRARLLRGIPTRPGRDRDEYPMAAARTTVDADVAYVDAAQNRGAGSVQGTKLRPYCSGQRFRVVWY